jgi:hypothetical protein
MTYIPPFTPSSKDPWIVRVINRLVMWWESVIDTMIANHPARHDINRMSAGLRQREQEWKAEFPEHYARAEKEIEEERRRYEAWLNT